MLFIMMDHLGHGHPGINNDTLETNDFDPFYKHLAENIKDRGYATAHIGKWHIGVDCNIKRIVDFLESRGAYDNTLIIFTSDNGAMSMGAYNGNMNHYEQLLNSKKLL